MKLEPKHLAILKAALHELDLKWRKGTANADFSESSIRWLRHETLAYEGDVPWLLSLIESGRFDVEFNRKPETKPEENRGFSNESEPEISDEPCDVPGCPGTMKAARGGGVKCTVCPNWFCY